MSFESHIADHLKDLKAKRSRLEYEQLDLVHDCDCDYCETAGSVTDENQEAWDKIEAEIKEVDATVERLKVHAKLHKIKVPKVLA